MRFCNNAARSAYGEYIGRSLSRLVDIALRTDDLQSLDYVFARLDSVPQTDKSGSLAYARAKALYARKDYATAKSAVNGASGVGVHAASAVPARRDPDERILVRGSRPDSYGRGYC